MRGTIAALTIGHHFTVGCHAGILVHLLQLRRPACSARRAKIARPLDVHRARHGAAAFRARTVLRCTRRRCVCRGPRVATAQSVPDLFPRCDVCASRDAGPLAFRWRPGLSVTGRPAAVHALNPPSSIRTDGWPKYSRNQNARAARTPDCSSCTTIGVAASTPCTATRARSST